MDHFTTALGSLRSIKLCIRAGERVLLALGLASERSVVTSHAGSLPIILALAVAAKSTADGRNAILIKLRFSRTVWTAQSALAPLHTHLLAFLAPTTRMLSTVGVLLFASRGKGPYATVEL